MLKINNNSNNKPSHNTLADPRNPRSYRKAVDVGELLLWTYQDQAADAVLRKQGVGIRPAGYRSNMVSIERNGMLGAKIDCTGSARFGGVDIHPDAEAVHYAVTTMTHLQIGLVIDYAKTGMVPDWYEGEEPRPVPVLRGNGKPKMEYFDPDRRSKPAYCLIEYEPEISDVRFARRVYVQWWDALALLVEKLQDLESHEVTGPAFPREPWLDGERKRGSFPAK